MKLCFPYEYPWTRKTTGFKFLRVNCQINQITSESQMDFLGRTCKKKGPKVPSVYYRRILYIQNSLGTKFQLKLAILNFWTKLTHKGYFRSKKRKKNENHHRILHIQIILDFKFQLQQTILIFWNKFLKKRILSWKTEKINITVEFFIFKDYLRYKTIFCNKVVLDV